MIIAKIRELPMELHILTEVNLNHVLFIWKN